MLRRSSLDQWARTADFSQPVRWGEVEGAILDRPPPPVNGEDNKMDLFYGVAGWLSRLVFAVVVGAALIGLGMVVIAAQLDPAAAEAWLVVARVFFVASVGVAGTVLWSWWGERGGTWVELVVAGVAGFASLAAFLATRTMSDVPGAPATGVYAVVPAAVGCLAFLLVLVTKPEFGTREKKPRSKVDPKRMPGWKRERYLRGRETVLTILMSRGIAHVSGAQQAEMVRMPLGSWHELDQST